MITKQRVNGIWVDYEPPPAAGSGDRIERVAQPIAKVIDKIAGTKIAGCGGCAKMKERLNAGITLKEAFLLRLREAAVKRVVKVPKVTSDQPM